MSRTDRRAVPSGVISTASSGTHCGATVTI